MGRPKGSKNRNRETHSYMRVYIRHETNDELNKLVDDLIQASGGIKITKASVATRIFELGLKELKKFVKR